MIFLFNNRKKDRTYLKMKNGKIIEFDESQKQNFSDIKTKKDQEIKQQKYLRLEEQAIESESNKAKKTIRKNQSIILKIALFLILVPIFIILGLFIYQNVSTANKDLKAKIEETTVNTTVIKETKDNQIQETEGETFKETEKTVTVQKRGISERNLNNILSSIDNYNNNINTVYINTKRIADDVLNNYGDALLAETEMEDIYNSLISSYSTLQQDTNLQENIPALFNILNERYKNTISLIKTLATNLQPSDLQNQINQSITQNNKLLQDQVDEEILFLDNNRIKYEINGLNIKIKGVN